MKRVLVGALIVTLGTAIAWPALGLSSDTARVRFYPDKTEIKPGETIVWTVEVLDASLLPLTVTPEFDNDKYREPSRRLEEAGTGIEFTYDTANLYVPYIEVDNYRGYRAKVYSEAVVTVLPSIEQREGIGLSVAVPNGARGDYIKAMNVLTFDHRQLSTVEGRAFLQQDLDRLAALGANMVIYNVMWFCDDETSSIHEPIYGDPWPACWVGTLPVDALVDFADWTHARGMRVCFRYFLRQKEDHASAARLRYNPSDDELYLRYQDGIKVAYAKLCQSLGIELICLDTENEAFTKNQGVSQILGRIRDVYSGSLTDGAYGVDSLLGCPFVQDLDFVSWSDYFFFHALLEPEQLSEEVLTDMFLDHYGQTVGPVLAELGKAGLFMEIGVNLREHSDASLEKQSRAYLEAAAELVALQAPICGIGWWGWTMTDPAVDGPPLRGSVVEGVVAEYFNGVLPEQVQYDFTSGWSPPAIAVFVEDFNETTTRNLEFWNQGGTFTGAIDRAEAHDGSSLRLTFEPSSGSVPFYYGFVWGPYAEPQDWTSYESLSFWVKTEAAVTWSSIEVNAVDEDGDRFSIRVTPSKNVTGWQLLIARLDSLTKPDWLTEGDGVLDLHRITRWGLGFLWGDGAARRFWLDDLYLGL